MCLYSKFMIVCLCVVTHLSAPSQADDGHETYQNTSISTFPNITRHQLYSKALKQGRLIDIAVPANYFETAETHIPGYCCYGRRADVPHGFGAYPSDGSEQPNT